MPENISTAALIPAAGLGNRLGLGPKAFIRFQGKTLLERVADLVAPLVDRVVVALPDSHLEEGKRLLGPREVLIVSGGATRQESVEHMLAAISEKRILIQDVARPFASPALIREVLDAAARTGAAGAYLSSHLGFARGSGGSVIGVIPAAECFEPQSPQAFSREVLERAYSYAREASAPARASWEMVIASGQLIHIVPGEWWNIKLTVPEDLDRAAAYHAAGFLPGTP